MIKKRERVVADQQNPFIDPDGYKKYVAERERAFLNELAKQKTSAAAANP